MSPIQYASFEIERSHWSNGKTLIAGIDEVGRGCFAGPVVAGAVIFPPNTFLKLNLADSKLLTPQTRLDLSKQIKQIALCFSIAEISVAYINRVGIAKAAQMAFRKAVKLLKHQPEHILIDAFYIKNLAKSFQQPIIHGDRLSASIAAASILAKVYRDELMQKHHQKYPNYNFVQNKGYGTKSHRQAIYEHGLCPLHRTSFNLTQFTNANP